MFRKAVFLTALLVFAFRIYAQSNSASTAWRNGKVDFDAAGVVGRSDIVLQTPNRQAREAMPLGNGRLGIAIWSENGLTAQLNRADTLPQRLSPGQVSIPGLKRMVNASDYEARLDLYNGEFVERGGGITATAYVQPDADVLIVDVSGADAASEQIATLSLWPPRHASVTCRDRFGMLEETWKDSTEAGASGDTFGSLAAITADARDAQARPAGSRAVNLSFRPKPDGSYRLFIAAPEWRGGDAVKRATTMFSNALISPEEHRRWWNAFWNHAGLMKITSEDHAGEYFENLRAIDLYTAAAESLGHFPGSQAGIGDLFSSVRDEHKWAPSAYWHWNLRMQVAANLGAGLYQLNQSYFSLYRDNLQNIQAWTKDQMAGRPGACVPETMRFNGKGYEDEPWLAAPGVNCSAKSKPYYNARTITTGAEVSLWMWQQFLATQDRSFLTANYPFMAASARFLLDYAGRGAGGTLHTFPSNAHETQWDVHDPTTDVAAMKTLFRAVIQAAKVLNRDSELVGNLQSALPHIPDFARTDSRTRQELLAAPEDSAGEDVIADSYDPSAAIHNTENIGVEPVWPYSLIGDSGPLHALGVRTYLNRPNKFENDWSFDPVQAARLGLADEVELGLTKLTKRYQAYPSGLAEFVGPEFYVEQVGVVATALQESLVQDYDGLVRIAPAWPKRWDVDGSVYIQGKSKVDVQIRRGVPATVAIEAGSSGHVRIRNPWPGVQVDVVSGPDKRRIAGSNQPILDFSVEAGRSYLLERSDAPTSRLPFEIVTGLRATHPKSVGTRWIGLPRTPAAQE